MEIRELRRSGEIFEYTKLIWDAEETSPQWFADAQSSWLDDFEAFNNFVGTCPWVFGIFDEEKLLGCIYFEETTETGILLVHLSVIGKIDTAELITHCIKIRDIVLHQGVRNIRGWIVKKNRGLLKILAKVGFLPVGLYMDHGMSHGRLIRWTMIEIRR